MFFAGKVWCIADPSSVASLPEQTKGLWGNHCLNSIVGN